MKIFQQGMFKQIFNMLRLHIYTAAVGTFLSVIGMGMFPIGTALNTLMSALFLVIYFVVIYIRAWECAEYDKKPYTTTSVYTFKGAVLPIGIIACNILLLAFYWFAWKFLSIDGMLATTTGVIYNMIYVIYTFMYSGFVQITKGIVSYQAHLMIVLVPVIASAIGYFAGTKGFTLSDKLLPFIYDKKEK